MKRHEIAADLRKKRREVDVVIEGLRAERSGMSAFDERWDGITDRINKLTTRSQEMKRVIDNIARGLPTHGQGIDFFQKTSKYKNQIYHEQKDH